VAHPTPAVEPRRPTDHIEAIFTKARKAFVKTDLKEAAMEIRKGAAVLRKQESRAISEVRTEIVATAEELDRLALRTEQGRVKAGSELDAVFARADRALARTNKGMAKTPAPGTAPTASAGHLEVTTPRPGTSATATRQAMP
jgi:hypothetical protein